MSKKDIKNGDEVYFLGSDSDKPKVNKKPQKLKWLIIIVSLVLVLLISFFLLIRNKAPEYYFEPETSESVSEITVSGNESDSLPKGYIEVLEETVNDVPLFLYIPHNSVMSLAKGLQDKSDSTIVFIAQAADIRADNFDIVGDFVLNGKRLSRGVAKAGFCAIIDGDITIGTADNTPFLQKAIDSGGYFFRQYPLVANGKLIDNNIKNKSIRRALGIRNGKVIMIESRSMESFHDFSQALIDVGINEAIYLVGSTAYGWYYRKEGVKTEFGVEKEDNPENTTYIVWRTE